jgi:hypothetical protein
MVADGRYPEWKFKMFYKAIFTRPAGMIYDNFSDEHNKIAPFVIPDYWPRYLGLDFGGVNTAGVVLAHKPDTNDYYLYREYLTGGRTAEEHAGALLREEPKSPVCYGGSGSEGQWRMEFSKAGLVVQEPPVSNVEVGINRVYSLVPNLYIFSTCNGILDEFGTYARELDDMGEPTERIADKQTFHRLDALRYIAARLVNTATAAMRQIKVKGRGTRAY